MIVEFAILLCLQAPVAGPVVAPFAPADRYEGHWGLDLSARYGSPVRASGGGTVTFAGIVAGMKSITIDHGGGLRSSVSFLSQILIDPGLRVEAGTVVGLSGKAHDVVAVHFSVRVDGEYTDPFPYLLCGAGDPNRLYPLPPPAERFARSRRRPDRDRSRPYSPRRAQRPTRWNLRPAPHRPSSGRGSRLPSARA